MVGRLLARIGPTGLVDIFWLAARLMVEPLQCGKPWIGTLVDLRSCITDARAPSGIMILGLRAAVQGIVVLARNGGGLIGVPAGIVGQTSLLEDYA